ncbi:cytochrome b/b6 domain-containing protein [Terasakiella pusilla]|uniref:cytochrome b/b6 domain-containing protein n=1 Tax=Terasakiella pusilla TaxID=64973 RepID=UPI003AA8BF48
MAHGKIKTLVFTRFERFWHWCQALLIVGMMFTGFGINGAHDLIAYEQAAFLHRMAAWTLMGLWVFAIFWMFTTGEWKQFIPTVHKLREVVRYYSIDIFNPEAVHPYRKTRKFKHNPLQRLAYLAFMLVIMPAIWGSGLLYLFYNDWPALGLQNWSLEPVAFVHVAAAFGMLLFFIGHVYMVFTATPVTKYLHAMLTGYEEVYPDDSETGVKK